MKLEYAGTALFISCEYYSPANHVTKNLGYSRAKFGAVIYLERSVFFGGTTKKIIICTKCFTSTTNLIW